jgi:hypothetical protein
VRTWYELLKDYDGGMVEQAYKAALTKCEFPVTIANIFTELRATAKAAQPSVYELYDIAKRTARELSHYWFMNRWEASFGDTKSGYEYAKEIYSRLPKALQAWKSCPLSLLQWWQRIDPTQESYVQHDFSRTMEHYLERHERYLQLNSSEGG